MSERLETLVKPEEWLPDMELFRDEQQFLARWKRLDDGCLVFTGHLTQGYGLAYYEGQQRTAARLRWEILTGNPLPESTQIIRKCGRRDCGELSHFELVSRSELSHRVNTERWGDEGARWKARITYDPETGCALWDQEQLSFFAEGHYVSARHYGYEQHYQTKLFPEEVLRPRCGCKKCVEPTHMERISRSEHVKRNNVLRWGDETERWQKSFHRDPVSGCLIGPERFQINGVRVLSHHYSYERYYKLTLAEGEVLHSLCGRQNCVEPTHRERMSMSEHVSLSQTHRWRKKKDHAAAKGT